MVRSPWTSFSEIRGWSLRKLSTVHNWWQVYARVFWKKKTHHFPKSIHFWLRILYPLIHKTSLITQSRSKSQVTKENIARIENAVQCHSFLSGNYELNWIEYFYFWLNLEIPSGQMKSVQSKPPTLPWSDCICHGQGKPNSRKKEINGIYYNYFQVCIVKNLRNGIR